MATEENPLLNLSTGEQRKLVNLVKYGDIQEISEETGLSRRQVLGIGGALLASAGVGGVTADQIIQEVKADASTTDSDGNVGLPGDRVDLYADGIDSNVVSARSVESVADVVVKPGGDVTRVETETNSGDHVFIGGDHTVSDALTFSGLTDVTLSLAGTLTLDDGGTAAGAVISLQNCQRFIVEGGVVDMDYQNNTDDGTNGTQPCISFGNSPSDILIRDMRLVNGIDAAVLGNGEDVTLRNLDIENTDERGVYCNVTDLNVENCTITNPSEGAIKVGSEVENITIRENHIDLAGNNYAYIFQEGIRDVRVSGDTVVNSGAHIADISGYNNRGAKNITFDNITVKGDTANADNTFLLGGQSSNEIADITTIKLRNSRIENRTIGTVGVIENTDVITDMVDITPKTLVSLNQDRMRAEGCYFEVINSDTTEPAVEAYKSNEVTLSDCEIVDNSGGNGIYWVADGNNDFEVVGNEIQSNGKCIRVVDGGAGGDHLRIESNTCDNGSSAVGVEIGTGINKIVYRNNDLVRTAGETFSPSGGTYSRGGNMV